MTSKNRERANVCMLGTKLDYITLTQFRSPSQGMILPVSIKVIKTIPYRRVDKTPDPDNCSLRLASHLILGSVKLTVKLPTTMPKPRFPSPSNCPASHFDFKYFIHLIGRITSLVSIDAKLRPQWDAPTPNTVRKCKRTQVPNIWKVTLRTPKHV